MTKAQLSEIVKSYAGGTPNRSVGHFYRGDIPWIKSGEINKIHIYDSEEHISKDAIKKSSAKMVEKGAVLLAMYGATAGVVGTYMCWLRRIRRCCQ